MHNSTLKSERTNSHQSDFFGNISAIEHIIPTRDTLTYSTHDSTNNYVRSGRYPQPAESTQFSYSDPSNSSSITGDSISANRFTFDSSGRNTSDKSANSFCATRKPCPSRNKNGSDASRNTSGANKNNSNERRNISGANRNTPDSNRNTSSGNNTSYASRNDASSANNTLNASINILNAIRDTSDANNYLPVANRTDFDADTSSWLSFNDNALVLIDPTSPLLRHLDESVPGTLSVSMMSQRSPREQMIYALTLTEAREKEDMLRKLEDLQMARREHMLASLPNNTETDEYTYTESVEYASLSEPTEHDWEPSTSPAEDGYHGYQNPTRHHRGENNHYSHEPEFDSRLYNQEFNSEVEGTGEFDDTYFQ